MKKEQVPTYWDRHEMLGMGSGRLGLRVAGTLRLSLARDAELFHPGFERGGF